MINAKETRNIIDHYAYWKDDAIRADLNDKRFDYSVVCCNIGNDFNIATVIRNANAFLAKEVVIYGNKKYDRRGTVGTHNYTNFRHVKSVDDLSAYFCSLGGLHGCKKIKIVGIDNVENSENINDFLFEPSVYYVLIFGQEQIGIPQEVLEVCDNVLYIPQYGSVRSINVGSASAIAMNAYCAACAIV
jgi:tRNA G18 (ribose-2'-O)-methylase SpoU